MEIESQINLELKNSSIGITPTEELIREEYHLKNSNEIQSQQIVILGSNSDKVDEIDEVAEPTEDEISEIKNKLEHIRQMEELILKGELEERNGKKKD